MLLKIVIHFTVTRNKKDAFVHADCSGASDWYRNIHDPIRSIDDVVEVVDAGLPAAATPKSFDC